MAEPEEAAGASPWLAYAIVGSVVVVAAAAVLIALLLTGRISDNAPNSEAPSAGLVDASDLPDRENSAVDTHASGVPSSPRPLTADQVYAAASPAVVRVIARDTYGRATGQGSGFFIDLSGTLVTNAHVIEDAESLVIVYSDETTAPAESVIALDEDRDLALLAVAATSESKLTLSASALPAIGTRVFAIGSPHGLKNSVSEGVVSGYRRLPKGKVIQTTAAISPGSSGGPLLDTNGDVIGVTTFQHAEGQNLNFAVPASAVRHLLTDDANGNRLLADDQARHVLPWLAAGIEAAKGAKYDRAMMLAEYARVSALLGRPDEAVSLLRLAESSVEPERPHHHLPIVAGWMILGHPAEARRAAESMSLYWYMEPLLTVDLYPTPLDQPPSADVPEAVDLDAELRRVTDHATAAESAYALLRLADRLQVAGDDAKALSVVEGAAEVVARLGPPHGPRLRSAVLYLYGRLNRPQRAQTYARSSATTADLPLWRWLRDQTEGGAEQIIRAYVEAGEYQRARSFFRLEIGDNGLSTLEKVRRNAGIYENARRPSSSGARLPLPAVDLTSVTPPQILTERLIALHQAEHGLLLASLRTLESARGLGGWKQAGPYHVESVPWILRVVGHRAARGGLHDDYGQLLGQLESDDERAMFCLGVVEGLMPRQALVVPPATASRVVRLVVANAKRPSPQTRPSSSATQPSMMPAGEWMRIQLGRSLGRAPASMPSDY